MARAGPSWSGADCTACTWPVERAAALALRRLSAGALALVGLGLLTYALINITWVFFRAGSFGKAWEVLAGMFGGNAGAKPMLATAPW